MPQSMPFLICTDDINEAIASRRHASELRLSPWIDTTAVALRSRIRLPFCQATSYRCSFLSLVYILRLSVLQSARKNALQVIAEYEGTPPEAVEVPDLSALRQLYSEKNPAVPNLR